MLTFNEYADNAHKTALYPDRGDNIYYPAFGLCGESGEIAEKIKKMIRDGDGILTDELRSSLAKELGDVLWYIAALSHEIGFELEDIAKMNNEKLLDRLARNKIKGSGDDR
jgi:NTP pyrophosphatase (non-canonical NTP hydrolase)